MILRAPAAESACVVSTFRDTSRLLRVRQCYCSNGSCYLNVHAHARTHTYFIFWCKRDIFQTCTTIQNFGVSNIWQNNRFIQHSLKQGCIKSIKSDSKNFLNNVKKYVFKCCSLELSVQRIEKSWFSTKILSSTNVFSIHNDNQKCFLSSKWAY